MDGVSIAASIIGIAEAGVQIATKLITLATQISTASDRVSSIGNDISLTSGVLRQLGELMSQNQKTTDDGIGIFKEDGLELTRKSAATCERIFLEVKNEATKASKQIRESNWLTVGKIKLSKAEKAKWPFLQPSIEILRGDLREAKGTLMLMLQLGSLALCKRMADLNQDASLHVAEQRDFMLAIKALLQDQKDAKGGVHHERKTSGQESSNTTTGGLGSGADKSNPPATVRINLANQALLNPPSSQLKLQPQGPDPSPIPESPPGTANDRKDRPGEHGPQERVVPPNLPEPKLRLGIHLFLLKPVVENFFDKVELTWLLQNTQMRESAIYRYMDHQHYETNVFNMLHTLHPYEKKILDGVIFGIDMSTEGSLLSLKRTKTTICHRDITFTDVPGLQFVVRRERQFPYEDTTSPSEIIEDDPRRGGTLHAREHRRRRLTPLISYDETYPVPGFERRWSTRTRHRRHCLDVEAAIESDEDRYPPARDTRRATVSSNSEDDGYEAHQEPMSLPEQDEDAVIDDMLKRYTRLFD